MSQTGMEVNNYPCAITSFHDDDFCAFKNNTTRIGSKLMNKMGYEGKGLVVNGEAL